MTDLVLLWIIEFLLFVTVALRLLLARKKGEALPASTLVSELLFPIALGIVLIILCAGGPDYTFPCIIIGVLWELILWLLRRRKDGKA